jgi:galactokinase
MSDVPQPALVARKAFVAAFGTAPEIIAYAPGRVNLIGEHTDYNDGFVLPCAIPFGTAVAISPRDDGMVDVVAHDVGARDSFAGDAPAPLAPDGHWSNHIRGVWAAMLQQGFRLPGANIAISGDVPQGAGLSSSASLGVALARGLAALAGAGTPDPVMLARAAQWSEHHYVGCQCGLMDQLAAVGGVAGHALLIDCRSSAMQPVIMPSDAAILIVHSAVTRELAESAYNDRRAECERAARAFGVAMLRDVDAGMAAQRPAGLDDIAWHRARHVVSENARVGQAVAALAAGDYATLGAVLRASHASLRDDFAVTVPAVDALADAMNAAIGDAGGARMTGGGFGGCLVAVLQRASVPALQAALADYFAARGVATPLLVVVEASDGAHLLPAGDVGQRA